MKAQFVSSDAWILLAIVYAGDNGNSANIIHIADGINHAIPTGEELSGAFSRLTKAGMIEPVGGGFKATSQALEAYARNHTPRRAIFQELEDMKRFLGVS